MNEDDLKAFRKQLVCNFGQLEDVFPDCITEAVALLSPQGVRDYLDGASLICRIGQGFEPVLIYLEEMPQVASQLGEGTLELVYRTVWRLSRGTNGKAIPNFLQTIAEAARRLGSEELLEHYVDLVMGLANRTSTSIHGNQNATFPSPGLPPFLDQAPFLFSQLSLEGMKNWVEYGIHNYNGHPERQKDYFSLQSADSRAILQRERRGTLFMDHERKLDLYMKALWKAKFHYVPYAEGWDELRKPMPYYDHLGIRVPDVYEDIRVPSPSNGGEGKRLPAGEIVISGIDRFRALLAHVAAHQRWSQKIIVDNFSPFQRVAIEVLEDSRVEYLAIREYPGLHRIWLALHPYPEEGACDPERESCIRHRLAMLSYAILNPEHGYKNEHVLECVQRFHELMAQGESNTQEIASLAVSFIARTRRQQDLSANVYFTDTRVTYRDDNRHLWIYIEDSDDEDFPEREAKPQMEDTDKLPPRHYPEWDYQTKTYRPDWVSLYESLHPAGDPMRIDALLSKHEQLAKRLKQVMDLLKPQHFVRVRYQEEGSELDLDVAIRSLIDLKAGSQPDPRINMSHRNDGRDIAVMLLLDLSQSLNEIPDGCTQTLLELSQEAVALMAWAVEQLGDEFAIAGFSSNSRHEVRYQHIKGYSERWDDTAKGRLAAIKAGYSTRMGAALRHAAHYLKARKADKKLLLVLTDGEPSDIDVSDQQLLIRDTHKAVQELDQQGIYTYCINLDPNADDYVKDIFGHQYSVIDRVERLPEKLPKLFMSLTR
ncbi:MAG: VWA domain-containing protein [Gammaproteobacteria bacterium]|nr:VWA domain-containing protein [Gammaproteobacteria bacterium]MBU1655584.1 VWA domain-containing protein [Gammaproteobacteria bacterium]MBU1961433.1 VWA domain-containing protein [Gammaproteobacteria bacterium]